MNLLSGKKYKIKKDSNVNQALDIAEISILGIQAKIIRKISSPVPTEVSVFIPRLEITKKIIEENRTIETSLILNSLTIVSSPRHEVAKESNGSSIDLIKQTKL